MATQKPKADRSRPLTTQRHQHPSGSHTVSYYTPSGRHYAGASEDRNYTTTDRWGGPIVDGCAAVGFTDDGAPLPLGAREGFRVDEIGCNAVGPEVR